MEKNNESQVQPYLKNLTRASIIVFVGIFISKILGYLYRIVIARYYGPDTYGVFLIALMVAGWFGAFASLGLLEGSIRYIAIYRGQKSRAKIARIFKASFLILLITSLVSGLLMFIFSEFIAVEIFHSEELTIFLKIFAILMPFSLLSNLFLSVIRAFEKISWHSFIFNILQNIFRFSSLILLIWLGAQSQAIVWSHVLAIVVTALVSFLVCKYQMGFIFRGLFKKPYNRLNEKIESNLLSYSWPIMFYTVISSVFFWIDSFSLGVLNGPESVGLYNAAVPIASLLAFIPEVFMQMFFPLIIREISRKKTSLVSELSKQVSKWILIINLPLFSLMIVFPGTLINLLFGPQYLVAENSLRILAVGMLASSLFIVSNNLVSAAGKSKLILLNILSTGLLNLVLNQILIPKYGIDGAAIATTISLLVLNLLFIIQARKYTSVIPLRRKMLNVAIVAIVSLGVLIVLKGFFTTSIGNMVLLGLIFGIIYLALILLTKSLDKNDLFIIHGLLPPILKRNFLFHRLERLYKNELRHQ